MLLPKNFSGNFIKVTTESVPVTNFTWKMKIFQAMVTRIGGDPARLPPKVLLLVATYRVATKSKTFSGTLTMSPPKPHF